MQSTEVSKETGRCASDLKEEVERDRAEGDETHLIKWFEPNDGQEKHSHLLGQFVYTAAIRLACGVYGVELKLDIPKSDPGKTRFKGQTLKTKIADAVLSVQPISIENKSTSTNEASAKETVRLGDIVSTPQIIPQGGVATQEGRTFFAVSARRPDLVGLHNISTEGLKGAIDLSRLERIKDIYNQSARNPIPGSDHKYPYPPRSINGFFHRVNQILAKAGNIAQSNCGVKRDPLRRS